MSKKSVTFFYTARSSTTLELTEEEIKTLKATGSKDFDRDVYQDIINRACNQHDDETSNTATDWEMDNDDYFEIEEE